MPLGFRAKPLIGPALSKFVLLAVLSGYLGLIGTGHSTVSVHSGELYFGPRHGSSAALACGQLAYCRPREEEDYDLQAVQPGAASYSRFSSKLQDERSIADQQRKCRDRAVMDGWEIPPHFEFADEAISGAKHDRAGFEALMDAARRGLIRVVYFENLSRLARDCVLTLQTLRELVYVLKVRIVSVDEGIDSATSDSWELLAAVLGMQNEQFLRSLAKFVFRGQEGLVLDNFCVGDYCFGFSSEPIPGSESLRRGRNPKPMKRYIIEPTEAAWVQMIFHWFTQEKRSLRWIAAELNRRGAPKDHRASTKHWYHQLLPKLLGNRKYIGMWPWGEMKNVRNPLTGIVRQEKRPAHETEKYLRHFPELRIIDDETFAKAQERLKESADALALQVAKNEKGRRKKEFAGSIKQAAETWPRHLLAGLIECNECGRRFYVGGGGGRYLFCPGYRMGVCACGTTLQRERAEKMILDAIVGEVLQDDALRDVVLQATLKTWEQLEQQLPSERAATEKALADVDSRIARLLDQCEREDVPDLSSRLQQRRQERQLLDAKLKRLDDATARQKRKPTEEWILAQLKDLNSVLSGAGPAAALALRKLVAGRGVVKEIRHDGKKRHYLQGEFQVHLHNLADALSASIPANDEQDSEALAKLIVIDFREPDNCERLADKVKEDFDAGMTFIEIGAKHSCSKQLASRVYAHWHRARGLPVPDGRALRARRAPVDMVMQAKAIELWQQDYLIAEIAENLGCRRDQIHAVVAAWYQERGLVIPDGRARRREIRLKNQLSDPDSKAG